MDMNMYMNPKPPTPQHVLNVAREQGLVLRSDALGDGASPPAPWPLRLMLGLGGWLVALPMLALLALLLFDTFDGYGGAAWGLVILVPSALLLRSTVGLFAEQLLVALLVAGCLLFGLSVGFEGGLRAGLISAGLLCAVLPWLLPQSWLRAALGAGAATALGLGLAASSDHNFNLHHHGDLTQPWLALHAWVLFAGVAMRVADGWGSASVPARWLQRLDDVAQGWMLATLVGLAALSGMTFLVGGIVDPGDTGSLTWAYMPPWMPWACACLALLAGAGLAWQAPLLRRPWLVGVALTVAVLAWWVPVLGGVLCALALLLGTHRHVLACTASVAAAWAIGAFYYALVLPLTDKALLLVALALLLLAMAWWGQRGAESATPVAAPVAATTTEPASQNSRSPWRWGAVVTVALVLLVANGGIWQKERLIHHGQPLFIPLAPVDPRSLMQGDFMRLDFVGWGFSQDVRGVPAEGESGSYLVLKREAQGIARPVRTDNGAVPLAEDELRLPLTHKAGRWVLVTDAFYFKEGEALRWETARFGEFRIDPSGRALLVTLRGENLGKL